MSPCPSIESGEGNRFLDCHGVRKLRSQPNYEPDLTFDTLKLVLLYKPLN
ncbi:MAG: hypothetical protein J7525_13200 [Roseofilum sp. SID3]|nr:hypothetical protein [Roseofilum sp. SID3]